MKSNFQITGIDGTEFDNLFELTDKELKAIGAERIIASVKPGFPCVVSLEDAEIGEEVLLFVYNHLKLNSPFDSKGPIFIRKNVNPAHLEVNEIPKNLEFRMLSLRAYDENGMMQNAKTVEGKIARESFEEILANNAVRYIQVHLSGPGCFNCQVNRS